MEVATRGHWRKSPENRWAFRNVDAIIPTAPVANDPTNVEPLPLEPQWKPNAVDRVLQDSTSTDALVVLVDGKLVYEYYANGNEASSRHILMSSTKAVTGLLLGILADAGSIDLEVPVTRYVPELSGTRYDGATSRDLIDMRAGVVLDAAEQRAYEVAVNWEPAAETPPEANLKAFFASLTGPPAEHGGAFRYISANTDLLGWVIERATGSTIATLLSERLWRPMGAEYPAYITLEQAGLARCAGGFCATARDFARLGQLLLMRGKRGDRSVIPQAVIDDVRTNADEAAWAEGEWGKTFSFISKQMGCRSGLYAVRDAPQRIFAMGIHGQNLFVDESTQTVIAKFSSWKSPNDPIAFIATHRGFLPRGKSFRVSAR